jgi:hypothetical protein
MSRRYRSPLLWIMALVLLCSWTYAIAQCLNDCPETTGINSGSCSTLQGDCSSGHVNPNDHQTEWACWHTASTNSTSCHNCRADLTCGFWSFSRCNPGTATWYYVVNAGCRTGLVYDSDTETQVNFGTSGSCC